MTTKYICYYDSLIHNEETFTDDIGDCLSEEWEYQSMPGRFPADDWTIDDVKIPMQGNLYYCGIHFHVWIFGHHVINYRYEKKRGERIPLAREL